MSTAQQTLIDVSRLALRARRLLEAGSHENDYRSNLRTAVRGLWSGQFDASRFWDVMTGAARRYLTFAWYEGAAAVGVQPDELSDEERAALSQAIYDESQYVTRFAEEIEKGSKANGGKLQPLFDRAELWLTRYNDLRNRAMVMARADAKIQWQLGPTKKHCFDCSRYANRVYRASAWFRAGVRPNHHSLACHGYHCLCKFVPVSLPLTRGRVPAMTGG